jgi:choline dehydrogenase-like flavoprotein
MAKRHEFIVVGSGGGGGTIAWLLAKAGRDVLLLEQGPDFAARRDPNKDFDPNIHDEFLFRLQKPDPKRRRRGDYNTFMERDRDANSKPFQNAWTGSVVGGGSVLWGTWAFRALPIDFKLKTHFEHTGQFAALAAAKYSVVDWPIDYSEMLPYFSVAEALLGVSGDREQVNESIRASDWYQRFKNESYWGPQSHWFPTVSYPLGPYTRTPVGQFFYEGYESVAASWKAFPTPMAIVQPGSGGFGTRGALAAAVAGQKGALQGEFWNKNAEELWSDRIRQACNMCGFCGEYLCWGKTGPKWGTQDTTLFELKQAKNACIQPNAKAIEIVVGKDSRRATGVTFLDLTDENNPKIDTVEGDFVIVSCGAVQTARLLLLSGPRKGLGNSHGQVGANACFHMFGLGVKATLQERFQGLLHGELGPTGNTSTFATYFMRDGASDTWVKGGHLTSAAKKNPLEDAATAFSIDPTVDILKAMTGNNRQLEVRLTADDLPMTDNRVSLDPNYVDEYGIPVARIARKKGDNEVNVDRVGIDHMNRVFTFYQQRGAVTGLSPSKAILKLIGDHQMGTCRMGDDAETSVVNRFCRLHEADNVFVVDSSFMPTGLGLNPMVTVVANALRVGTHILDAQKKGRTPGQA